MKKIISVICASIMLMASISGCESSTSENAATFENAATEEATKDAYIPKYPLSNPNADVNAQKVYDMAHRFYSKSKQEKPFCGL